MPKPVKTTTTEGAPIMLLRPKTVCEMLSIAMPTFYKLIQERKLDSFLEGRTRYVTMSSIVAYIKAKTEAARASIN